MATFIFYIQSVLNTCSHQKHFCDTSSAFQKHLYNLEKCALFQWKPHPAARMRWADWNSSGVICLSCPTCARRIPKCQTTECSRDAGDTQEQRNLQQMNPSLLLKPKKKKKKSKSSLMVLGFPKHTYHKVTFVFFTVMYIDKCSWRVQQLHNVSCVPPCWCSHITLMLLQDQWWCCDVTVLTNRL